MTYELALAYLAGLNESRIRPGLERISAVLSRLGSPHLDYPHIIVGGTNGKGSVVALMGAVLDAAGYRAGRFTSPHLERFEERIVVAGREAAPAEVADLGSAVRRTGVDLSYFEFATAMALLHFSRSGARVALLEVGLGGRWDATNATEPILSVITGISLDHQSWLGESIREIATEKGMIMRRERPVVIGCDDEDALQVLLSMAGSAGAKVLLRGRDFRARWEGQGDTLQFEGRRWSMSGLRLGLPGRFQIGNAAVALAALEVLDTEGFPVDGRHVAEGLEGARWRGRFHLFGGSPAIIVDAAHNREAARALVGSIPEGASVVWVLSALGDKDLGGMATEMLRVGSRFVLVPLDHPRAMTTGELRSRMPPEALVTLSGSLPEGIEEARRQAGEKGLVVVAGSVFLAAKALGTLEGLRG
ncbi:MAG: bifunctional folylpolyglutamate synthase/dihydrofolate synthase [bacterium]|nr:MAG: bifunctional folylpolyglutamate synthase/dihydrofolate synthase [bacterium]